MYFESIWKTADVSKSGLPTEGEWKSKGGEMRYNIPPLKWDTIKQTLKNFEFRLDGYCKKCIRNFHEQTVKRGSKNEIWRWNTNSMKMGKLGSQYRSKTNYLGNFPMAETKYQRVSAEVERQEGWNDQHRKKIEF